MKSLTFFNVNVAKVNYYIIAKKIKGFPLFKILDKIKKLTLILILRNYSLTKLKI